MALSTSADTAPAAAAVQFAAWRAMSATDKLALVRDVTATVLWMEREGLRLRWPALDDAERQQLAVAQRLGPALAARVYSSRG